MDHGAQVILPVDLELKDENLSKCHLLHFAADDGFTDIARLLIEKGKIPVNTLDQTGWSSLHLAAGHNYLDIVKLLLENGAEINIKVG
jgi:ankyrin repeat protein